MTESWEGFRLSRQQEHVLGPDAAGLAGRTVAEVRLAEPIERAVLESAAQDVASAHEILRTDYRKILGEHSALLMVIEDEPRIRVSERSGDSAALATAVREAQQVSSEESALDLVLFGRTDTDQGVSLIVSAPRMSMDVASVEVFLRDLQQACAARLKGEHWTRDDIAQYADYAQWQFEEAVPTGADKERAAERQARLAALPPLHLPLELRSAGAGHEDLEWTVPADLARKLRDLGDSCDSGLRGVLLAGWLGALWHATGRPDGLAVDTTLPRRTFSELATSIGRFESPVPVFADVAEATTLQELLSSVGRQVSAFEQPEEGSAEAPRQFAASLPGFTFSDVASLVRPGAPAFSDLRIQPSDDAHKVALEV
ncbi:condensation domain-containing protein, partial [Streptomyces anulatus]